ncbi:MAG: amidohydrolase family protein [Acidobacteria bacterium]|nr:amidohydrolase family protein [Acidobacteriota bacterium]
MLTRREAIFGAVATGLAVAARQTEALLATGPQPATPLNFKPPAGTTDTHRHIFGNLQRYPYAPTSGYRHEPATAEDMAKLDRALHIDRVVLIQPSGYGTDNSCLLDGLKALGPKSRGIVAIDDKTRDTALDQMQRAGVRGIRLNIGRGVEGKQRLADAAARIKGRGWHINTAIQLGMLESLQDAFAASPVPIVLDHYAGAKAADGTSQSGFDVVLKLLKSGNVYMKMSRLHNVSTQAPGYSDVEPLTKAVLGANPERLLWGTDWPHAGVRPEGYKPTDISPYFKYDDGLIFNEFARWVGDAVRLKTILVDNPARLYGFR